jgi:hypothetical protein
VKPGASPAELLSELVLENLGVAELAARHGLGRRAIEEALSGALAPGRSLASGACAATWELAVYLTGRRDVTLARRRELAAHLEGCPPCRAAKELVAQALEQPWAERASTPSLRRRRPGSSGGRPAGRRG